MKLPGNKNSCELLINVCGRISSVPLVLTSSHTPVSNLQLYVTACKYVVYFCFNIAGADDGIEEIEGAGIILKCLQTRTGIKFVLT